MSDKKELFAGLREKIDAVLSMNCGAERMLEAICTLLANEVEYYDWVGFYLVTGRKDELVLGPFVGAPTEHVCIPFGKGICGQAAAVGETVIIQDVTKVTNYLSCAPDVLSEIVVPIFGKDGRILGEIDIDSHDVAPFSFEDKEFLEYIAQRLPEVVALV
ncbi:MAG: GAF domain-containing protein [Candidatus Krumholzibacteria bacterium]|nr:GAF domain-containing protein [Candidatus Krumholzibacteria bacterium]